MSSPPPPADPVTAKCALLLATAERLFYRDGYRVVGIDTLLAEAGVAKMTLYNHFDSKEDLIIAVLEMRDKRLRAALEAAIEAAGRSPLRRLGAVFDWLENWFNSADFNGCAFIRALSEYPDPSHEIHQTAWRHKAAIIRTLEGMCTAAEAKDPAKLAQMISLLIDGAIISARATRSAAPAGLARTAALNLLKQAAA